MSNYVWMVALMGLGLLMLSCEANSMKPSGRIVEKDRYYLNGSSIYIIQVDNQEYVVNSAGGIEYLRDSNGR